MKLFRPLSIILTASQGELHLTPSFLRWSIPALAAIALLCALSLGVHAQTPQSNDLPKAPGAEVFSLTPAPGYFTEPGIAVNPRNPQQVVAVYQDNAHAAWSRNARQEPGGYMMVSPGGATLTQQSVWDRIERRAS